MGTRSAIAPMCILVKDHSRVLCEQLQQLRLQSGLVDLDIVCEDHHINVHKVVMAACSKFFKDQLCKVNVQVPVILRLEDFGLELKRDAVSYIIEFVYRGEVNIPGERLTDVCQAAHTLGVVGLEHLPVPAPPTRPNITGMSKDHLQIADESELRGDTGNSMSCLYNSLQPPTSGQYQGGISKLAMDISNINVNPFFHMNNNPGQSNDDIILLQTTEDQSRGIHQNTDPDIIPISFGDSSHQHQHYNQPEKINLIVSEASEVSDHQYRIIPEIMSDGTFHEETIDSCLSLFPGGSEPQDLSPVKTQETQGIGKQRHGVASKNITNNNHSQGGPLHCQAGELTLTGGSNPNALQALFEAATGEYVSSHSEMSSRSSSIVFSSPPSTHLSISSSAPSKDVTDTNQKHLPQIKTADCSLVDSKKQSSPGKSLSQGKLRVINQGIQSENIQSPSLAEYRNKSRRRSGQISGYNGLSNVPPLCPSSSPSHHPAQSTAPTTQLPRVQQTGVRLLSVGPQDGSQDCESGEIVSQESSSDSESESEPSAHDPGLSTPGLVPWPTEELWHAGAGTGWTHPVESVDTAVPTSGAVWQLPPTSQSPALPSQWLPPPTLGLPDRLSLPEPPALSLIPPSCPGSRQHPSSIPWNTPVTSESVWTSSTGGTGGSSSTCHAPRDTPPGLAVSWTQPQTSASPSPASSVGVTATHCSATNAQSGGIEGGTAQEGGTSANRLEGDGQAGPSWRSSFGDDNMLAIRSGIPLALQNKAIRSGVPIGPFQNKRKRKSRASQDGNGGKTKKRPSIGGKRGDLEVRKDLTIESQRTQDELEQVENVFENDDSRPSTSNIVSKTKEETNIGMEPSVSSPIGGVHIKTVKKLNEFSSDCSEMRAGDMTGESSKADKLQFTCINCSSMFSSAGQLKRHTQSVHGKEETLFCQICTERCHGKENLKLHMYKTHGIGELFRCEECNYESSMKACYIKHISEHIPQEAKKKKCPKCEKVFKTKTGLNMHLKQHFDESLFSCLVCDFKTPQKLNLIKHTASKHGQDVEGRLLEMNYSCESCDFKCIAEHMLKNHFLRKHTKKAAMRFHCTQCDYATVEKAALDKHMRFKHTNERPFMCDTCGFSTHTASAMARHKRSHSNSKPHKCAVCGHEYADRKRLRDHMYLHSDHKPFKCELCSYTCRRKDNLTAHLKKQHSVHKLESFEERSEEGDAHPDSTSSSPLDSRAKSHTPRIVSPLTPSSLPTIAMADIAVPSSRPADVSNRPYEIQENWIGGQGDVIVLPQSQDVHTETLPETR